MNAEMIEGWFAGASATWTDAAAILACVVAVTVFVFAVCVWWIRRRRTVYRFHRFDFKEFSMRCAPSNPDAIRDNSGESGDSPDNSG